MHSNVVAMQARHKTSALRMSTDDWLYNDMMMMMMIIIILILIIIIITITIIT